MKTPSSSGGADAQPRAAAAPAARWNASQHGALDEHAPRAAAALPGRRGDRERGLGDARARDPRRRARRSRSCRPSRARGASAAASSVRLAQRASDRPGAGEEDRRPPAMQRQRAARVSAPPCTTSNTPSGSPASRQRAAIQAPHRGRELARLEHDAVAGRERRHDVAVREMRGEVERAEAPRARRAGGSSARAPGAGFDRRDERTPVRERDARPSARAARASAARVPERLADLARDQPRELLGALARPARRSGAAPRRAPRSRASRQAGNASRARATAASTLAAVRDREAPDLVGGIGGRDADEHLRHSRPARLRLAPRQRRHAQAAVRTRSPRRRRAPRGTAARRTARRSSSSGTTVARKPCAPSAESSASGPAVRVDGSRDEPGQHQLRAARAPTTIASREAPYVRARRRRDPPGSG